MRSITTPVDGWMRLGDERHPPGRATCARRSRTPSPPGCVEEVSLLCDQLARLFVGSSSRSARSHSSAGLRAMRGRLWHQRRRPRPPHTAPGWGERRCQPDVWFRSTQRQVGRVRAPHRHGGSVPCDLDRWWHPTRPGRHVPRTSSSGTAQRHLSVPKRRESSGGGGDDRSDLGRVIRHGLAARKRRVGASEVAAVPRKTNRKVIVQRMVGGESRLRRRAAPRGSGPSRGRGSVRRRAAEPMCGESGVGHAFAYAGGWIACAPDFRLVLRRRCWRARNISAVAGRSRRRRTVRTRSRAPVECRASRGALGVDWAAWTEG